MEARLQDAFAVIESASLRRAEKEFLRKHALTVFLSEPLGVARSAGVQPMQGVGKINSSCLARDKVLHRAGQAAGRKLGIVDLQVELNDMGYPDLSKRVEVLSRARRVEAHPDICLADDVAQAFASYVPHSFETDSTCEDSSSMQQHSTDWRDSPGLNSCQPFELEPDGLDVWFAQDMLQKVETLADCTADVEVANEANRPPGPGTLLGLADDGAARGNGAPHSQAQSDKDMGEDGDKTKADNFEKSDNGGKCLVDKVLTETYEAQASAGKQDVVNEAAAVKSAARIASENDEVGPVRKNMAAPGPAAAILRVAMARAALLSDEELGRRLGLNQT